MSEINLKPVWDATLNVYREVAKICNRHGLKYYVTDGTAIGAVRHGGFIPWDDDFDMSMPREDYEQFRKYALCELPSHLKFVNWENTPEFSLLFGKVQESRRDLVEKIEKDVGRVLSNGIFIDIFPIDGYPESKLERLVTKISERILFFILIFKEERFRSQLGRRRIFWLAGACFSILFPWLNSQSCKRICENMLLKHPFKGSRICGRASLRLTLLNRGPLMTNVWGQGIMVPFYGETVPIPKDIDTYLRFYYGDYMRLPPEDQRVPSHSLNTHLPWWLGPTNSDKRNLDT